MKSRLNNIKIKTDKKTKKVMFSSIVYPAIPTSINDIYIITTAGDRLDMLAHKYYANVKLWWIIANAN